MAERNTLVVRKRIAGIFFGALGVFFCLFCRIFIVQVISADQYQQKALNQRMRPVMIDAKRGTIYDRNGKKLAISVNTDALYAVPREIENPKELAKQLAPIIDLEEGEIFKKLTRKSSGEWLKRKLTVEQSRKIKELNAKGLSLVPRPQRFYPEGKLAAHVLGIAGVDNQGLEGLELQYDRYLKGVQGKITAERDATGREIPGGIRSYVPPEDGADLVLTIDSVIQHIAERELDRAMAETGSRQGMALIMDPNTGEILAMAIRPTFDPNNYSQYPQENRKNILVTDLYEPGSTFKIFTSAAALEEGIVKPQTQFYDPGHIVVSGHRLRCWRAGGHGSQTFTEAVENSCNPVFAQLGMDLGPERFHKYLQAFGFGQKTGIDFPGEAQGTLASPSREAQGWLVRWANIGFGQGVSVTPIQLLTAAAAIANGGKLVKPYLVREIRKDKEVIKKFQPEVVREVLSESTAKQLRQILRSVVENGSGSRADLPGYSIGGKTGTGQIAEGGGYSSTKVNASFLGFGPSETPKLLGLVVLREPQTAITYGGTLAAPPLARILADSFAHLGVAPQLEKKEEEDSLVTVPNVRNYPPGEAQQLLLSQGLTFQLEGAGKMVTEQNPKPAVRVKKGTKVIIYCGRAELDNKGDGLVTVPPLEKMTVRDVANTLSLLGLKLEIEGSGIAVRQAPAAGQRVKPGTTVRVFFELPVREGRES